MGLENRLRRFEDATRPRPAGEETVPTDCGEFWEMDGEYLHSWLTDTARYQVSEGTFISLKPAAPLAS